MPRPFSIGGIQYHHCLYVHPSVRNKIGFRSISFEKISEYLIILLRHQYFRAQMRCAQVTAIFLSAQSALQV